LIETRLDICLASNPVYLLKDLDNSKNALRVNLIIYMTDGMRVF